VLTPARNDAIMNVEQHSVAIAFFGAVQIVVAIFLFHFLFHRSSTKKRPAASPGQSNRGSMGVLTRWNKHLDLIPPAVMAGDFLDTYNDGPFRLDRAGLVPSFAVASDNPH